MNIRHNELLREKLASEYVLGTLKGGARRRFQSWLTEDAALRRSVAEWQDRLCPLAEWSPPVVPSAHIWRGIEKRLDAQAVHAENGTPANWWNSIYFWRRVGIASSAMTVLLLVALLARQPDVEIAMPTYVAVLADQHSRATMVITGDTGRRQLTVKVVAPSNIGADKSLELWALPKDGPPRSLGLVAANQSVILPLPENMSPQSVPALAVSLEPKGGSPNPNAPTGPVLFTGGWMQV